MKKFKSALKSKTVWAGISAIVASLALYFTGEATVAELLLGAQGILAIVLRFVTTQPIK